MMIRLCLPEIADSDIVFVDTPGFDDTTRSDTDVFEMISTWLIKTYFLCFFLFTLPQ